MSEPTGTAAEGTSSEEAGPAHPEAESPAETGEARASLARRLVAYAFVALVLALADPAKSRLAPWGLPAGAAVVLAGEALRIWACGHLWKNRFLVTAGPYAYVRNPLYLGTLLILVGFCVAAGGRFELFGLLPFGLLVFFGYYAPRKERVESARLRKRCPRFPAYHAAVRGYLPRLTPWEGSVPRRWSAELVVLNSEVETIVLVVLGLAVLTVRAFA